ncbi:Putative coat protein [Evansella caseinilytica]|uniref:Putative coat protein n=1 Tax=Evansella caseinilytica TaxID=1503961 RepID=A0A1H3MKC7_9BACI|nr:YlbD family protein [Evansella caseinilytica]SDY77043.1 Putative coat protein [Evansella caseinilytica]
MNKSLHPDVRKFKVFVKKNPHVLRDVKSGEKTLQDLFEEWLLFGEEDDIWETYRSKENSVSDEREKEAEPEPEAEEKQDKSSDTKEGKATKDLIAMLKKMNFNDLQNHLTQFSGVLGSIQELLAQFRPNHQPPSSNTGQQQQQQSPFTYRDD